MFHSNKKIMRQKKLLLVLVIALISILFFSCKKDEPNPNVVFTATLSGANERPNPTPSTATGTATLTFNKDTKIFTLVLTYDGLVPTAGHIHKGATDVAGAVVFPFNTLTSPINYTSVALTTEQEADLNAGLYYANLHTSAYPSGEIRGQLLKQ